MGVVSRTPILHTYIGGQLKDVMNLQYSAKIDWLSFVIRTPSNDEPEQPRVVPHGMMKSLRAEFGDDIIDTLFVNPTPMLHGRAPYRWGYNTEISKTTLFCGGEPDHMTWEFSGQACEIARRASLEPDLLLRGANLCTRIDKAVDIATAMTPQELVAMCSVKRAKTRSEMTSQSGTTVYIGSMKSEHYARIYRYNDPHPRAGLLRIEFVARRERAKNEAAVIEEHGIGSILKYLWDELGLPEILDFEASAVPVSLNDARPERDGKNTVSWLIKQAAPAFKRMLAEGHIANGEEFLREFFLGY